MSAIKVIWKNGQIILEGPADWPEGTRLKVEVDEKDRAPGIPDAEWPTDAEGIAQLLAGMDQIQPPVLTQEEEAALREARQAQRDFEAATFIDRADKLRGMWE
jgi:hypothetical protein